MTDECNYYCSPNYEDQIQNDNFHTIEEEAVKLRDLAIKLNVPVRIDGIGFRVETNKYQEINDWYSNPTRPYPK